MRTDTCELTLDNLPPYKCPRSERLRVSGALRPCASLPCTWKAGVCPRPKQPGDAEQVVLLFFGPLPAGPGTSKVIRRVRSGPGAALGFQGAVRPWGGSGPPPATATASACSKPPPGALGGELGSACPWALCREQRCGRGREHPICCPAVGVSPSRCQGHLGRLVTAAARRTESISGASPAVGSAPHRPWAQSSAPK